MPLLQLSSQGDQNKGPTTYNITTEMIEIKGIKDIPQYTHIQIASLALVPLLQLYETHRGGRGTSMTTRGSVIC